MKLARVVVSIALGALATSCSGPAHKPVERLPPRLKQGAHTLTIIGTNDLHGAIDRLPLFAGFVANVRAARQADGGAVLLLDGGDMFQGTLESNLAEGADIVRAYNAIGYTAAAVGNHEFDFGPAGPQATPSSPDDDPRGALKARAAEAKFPFLVSNISDTKSGARIKWPNMPASILVDVGGTQVGIIGASTESTPYTTMAANFVGLSMKPPTAEAIATEARALRAKGAQVIVVTAHIGSACETFDKPNDTSSCKTDEEVFKVINDLPKGLVDVWVGGHTHAGIAHRINDVAVIESYSSGRAFGRVDLRITSHVSGVTIHPPKLMCALDKDQNPVPVKDCQPGEYEGKPVTPVAEIQTIVADSEQRAAKLRDEKLGPTLIGVVTAAYSTESAEGNWFTDLMLAARPDAQVSLTNGGGLRADIPAGDLTYGQLYQAMPFDNRFAVIQVKGKHIRRLVTNTIQRSSGIFSFGGLSAKARCKNGLLDVQITMTGGKPLVDDADYRLVTSDFLASGGDGVIGRLKLPEGSITMTDAIIRDAIADVLRKRKGRVDPLQLYNPAKRRLDYEGKRPVECQDKSAKKTPEEPD